MTTRSLSPSLVEAMDVGVKLKMPVGLLGHATRAQKALDDLRRTGGVEGVVLTAFQKFESELQRLKEACELVKPVDEQQQAAKDAWIERNVGQKEKYLAAMRSVFETPKLQLNDKDVEQDGDGESMRSAASRASSGSAGRLARAEAAARTKALEIELEHRQRQRQLEEQERQLRQQREDEEIRMKIRQSRVMEEALEEESQGDLVEPRIRVPQERIGSAARTNVALDGSHEHQGAEAPPPGYLPPIATWAPRPSPGWHQGPAVATWAPPPHPQFHNATNGLLQQVLLPQSALPTFKGEQLEFMWFLKAFETRVEAVTADPAKRLHLLLQHLEGDAKTLVKGCQLADDPAVGYARAKDKLITKYGNKVRQALAFKTQLLTWPNIRKDAVKDLERFSIQLQLCEEVKLTGGLAELDASGTLLQLMHKLPFKMQEAWQMRAHKIETMHYREANFEDFCRFVCDLAAARNHPVFGTKQDSKSDGKKGSSPRALATVAEEHSEQNEEGAVSAMIASKDVKSTASTSTRSAFEAPCIFCTNNHAGHLCRKALQMPIRERRNKLSGLCFGCLKAGHTARQCKQKAVCDKCKESHPTVLHFEKVGQGESAGGEGEQKVDKSGEPGKNAGATACATSHQTHVAVAVLPVRVWGPGTSETYLIKAILDPGSTATFITDRLVKRMGLSAQDSTVSLTTMTKSNESVKTRLVSGLKVGGIDHDSSEPIALPPAFTVATMPYNRVDLAGQKDVIRWSHLDGVPFQWCQDAEVEVLIGMNCPDALKPKRIVSGGSQEPYAVQTALGWCVNGPLRRGTRDKCVRATSNLLKTEEVEAMVERLHNADFEDAYNFETKAPSQEDQLWLQKAQQSITRSNESDCGQYQIALPLRQLASALEDNHEQAWQRLQSLRHKFVKNHQFHVDYSAFMTNMESQGYVEDVSKEQADSRVFYVPHHGVYHPRKPGKIRVVFNCSSRYRGVSLNDCLIPGPDLTNSLLGVLLRFREEAVALTADIESMFYRVQVPQCDRDLLRYLWWPGGDVNQTPKIMRMKVHLFGAASSPSCANFALRKAADDALDKKKIDKDVCDAVKDNFYVDDCLKSMPTETEAIRMAKGLVVACGEGGFRLTKFVSTSVQLLSSIPEKERAKGLTDIDLSNKHDPLGALQERALGVLWNVMQDEFRVSVADREQPEAPTKRGVLRVLSSVYDPMGMVAPVVIVARILFRNLTKAKDIGWDDTLVDADSKGWKLWTAGLPELQEIRVPRCFRPIDGEGGWQLHVFCDASEEAFAAVAYLRQVKKKGGSHVAFVMGKARVTPPKVVTIPRLELTAAKLATEVATMVQHELRYQLESRTFWTDSQTVLRYLNNTVRRFHTFVANRVGAILNSSKLEEWRYVPTSMNPADEGSRGKAPADLKSSMWLTGPEFLQGTEDLWPDLANMAGRVPADDPEVHSAVTLVDGKEDGHEAELMEQMSRRYSSFYRLKKAVQTWKNFICYLRIGRQRPPMLCSEQEAEHCIVKCLQRQKWPEELERLQEGKMVKKTSSLYRLDPILEGGIMLVGSRLRATLPIVSGSSWAAELLVRDAHISQMHFGRQATAARTLRNHWIVGLNKVVRRVVKECPKCQRRSAKPQIPKMGYLPEFRSDVTRAFETTGVDYFGPFVLKRARTEYKAYGVIFTCAQTRAVHLEVAEDLSTSAFLNALRRFIARRGHVKRLISDNGTNFVGAEAALTLELQKELKRLQNQAKPVVEWMAKKGIEWRFNPPGASHQGGFWERLIRSVRKALWASIPSKPLTYDGFITVLCEVESVLNARPLTPISEDPNDLEALTPNHLLLGISGPSAPPGDYKRATIPLKRQWRQVQHVSHCFWKRWLEEYRVLLHQRQKWHDDKGRPMQIDDVVLVIDAVKPRDYWPLGRVVMVHPGKDSRVRVVTVKTAKGLLKRPVAKLCRLEAASESCKADQ